MRDRGRALAALLMGAACGWLCAERAWATGGAYVVDDSEVGPPGECKLESWGSARDGGDYILAAAPTCVLAALPMVEWSLQFQHRRSDEAYGNELAAGVKIALLPIERFGLGIALAGGLLYDLRDDRVSGGYLLVPASVEPIDDLRLSANLGWRHDDVAQRDYATWGFAADWTVLPNLMLIAEVFGENEGAPGFQAGPRLTVLDGAVDLDLILGRNLAGLGGEWITLGLTARF